MRSLTLRGLSFSPMNAARSQAVEECVAIERHLLVPTMRRSLATIEKLLHPDFVQVTPDGRTWSRSDILDAITNDTASAERLVGDDFQGSSLDENTVLITSATQDRQGRVRRTSIWTRTDSTWLLRFHQATTIS